MILIKAIFLGLLIAAPPGPVWALCFRRAISKRQVAGLISGLGASLADAFFASIVILGLTVFSDFIFHHQFWIRLVGVAFFLFIGIKLIDDAPKISLVGKGEKDNLFADFLSTFFLTLTNPTLLLSFSVLFTLTGFSFTDSSPLSSIIIIVGVFLGAMLWWVFLGFFSEWLRSWAKDDILVNVNRAIGFVVLIFATSIMIHLMFLSNFLP